MRNSVTLSRGAANLSSEGAIEHPTNATRRSRVALTSALALICACSGDREAARPAFEVTRDTVGDTITVRTMAGSLWGEARLIEEVRIGRFDGPDELTFGDIGAIATGPDGTLYVLERQPPSVRAYSADGRHLKNLGREGEGPGELRGPDAGLSILPDGRILVRDPANARISVFRPDGEYDTEWRIRGSSSTSTPLFVDRSGNAYQQLFEFSDDGGLRFSFVRYDTDGEAGDTILVPPADDIPRLVALREDEDGTSRSSTTMPFWPRRPTTLSPDGEIVIGHSGPYSIDIPRGHTVLRIQRTYEPVAVLGGERSNWRERITHNLRRTEPGWDWDGPDIPDTKPAFRDMKFDEDGRLWVQVHTETVPIPSELIEEPDPETNPAPPTRWREPVRYDVFDVDGDYLGAVEAPAGFVPDPYPSIRGDVMWAIVTDELEISYLVRYRIAVEEPEPLESAGQAR